MWSVLICDELIPNRIKMQMNRMDFERPDHPLERASFFSKWSFWYELIWNIGPKLSCFLNLINIWFLTTTTITSWNQKVAQRFLCIGLETTHRREGYVQNAFGSRVEKANWPCVLIVGKGTAKETSQFIHCTQNHLCQKNLHR